MLRRVKCVRAIRTMNEKSVASLAIVFFLAVLVYAPTIWFVYRKVRFRPMIRFMYGLTAAPVFVGLLLVNIGLVVRFWPAGPQLLQQAHPIRERRTVFFVMVVLCALAVVGSWLWYRFFAWLNRLMDWEPPNP